MSSSRFYKLDPGEPRYSRPHLAKCSSDARIFHFSVVVLFPFRERLTSEFV